MQKLTSLYLRYFNFIIRNSRFEDHEGPSKVHRLIIAVFITSILMWSYALNSLICIDSDTLKIIGFTCAIGHFLSPLLFKMSHSISLSTHSFLIFGFIFQFTHSYYTGGFYSNTIIWFSILPLIAAVIIGIKGLIIWSITALVGVFTLLYFPPQIVAITPIGKLWAQLNMTLGYTALILLLMFVFISLENSNKKKLAGKNESIKKLLRIVGHDIANPLTITLTSNELMKRMIESQQYDKLPALNQKIHKSIKMISDVLDNTRKLEVLNEEEKKFSLENILLNDIIENSLFVFQDKLKNKNLVVDYDFENNKDITLKAEKITIKNEVFNNLFSNAIKFSNPNGKIRIYTHKNKNAVKVYFQDFGTGIEPKILKNIFKSEVKTTRPGTNGEEGTGFGMPILYSTLNEIGASIEVKSSLIEDDPINHGTIFIMSFFH